MAKDITKKSDADLAKELHEKQAALHEQTFGIAGGATRDVKQVRADKKEIARIKTELRRRELEA